MKTEQGAAVLLGHFPSTVLAACRESATAAGLEPVAVFRTAQYGAVIMGSDETKPLFVRWRGPRASRAEWTYDPSLFSRQYKARSLRALSRLLADPAAPRKRA